MHNIGLYIYTVNTNPVLKYPIFSEMFQKKNISKHFQKEKIFCCIRPNPKIFPSIFFIKKNKNYIFFMLKKNFKNGYRNQFMIIH